MHRRRICVFVGPSLPPSDRVEASGLSYLPPASRGDVIAASRQFDSILLIDGVFHHDLAPSPKEVLQACRRVPTFGAASIGALRAAECWPFGMVPLGIIARWYIREIIDGDDEVAVLMHPQTHAALSVPSVNVRYVAWLARRRGILGTQEASDWVHSARTKIFYMDRTWDLAAELASAGKRGTLRTIAEEEGDLKRWDAQFALRHLLRFTRTHSVAAL